MRNATAAIVLTAVMTAVLMPAAPSEAAEPTVIFSTDFEGIGIFIRDWEPLGWSRGEYAAGHDDDQWCRANADSLNTLSRAVGYTVTAHSSSSVLYGAKIGTNSINGVSNLVNGYPDPGMDSWVRYAPPNAARYDGMTLSFWYWAKTHDPGYTGELTDYLCVNLNNGLSTWTAWKQPAADSGGWQQVVIELPPGTVWMEWEYKTSMDTVGHYPGVMIDDMVLTTGKVLPAPMTSRISGLSPYSNSRTVQVPVSVTDADRFSLYYRTGGSPWTMYSDPSAPDGMFTLSPVQFKVPADGRYELYSLARNSTDVERKPAAAEAAVTVDTVPPALSLTAPDPSTIFGSAMVTVEWSASDVGTGIGKATVSLDGGAPATAAGSSYTFRSLSSGAHTAVVRVQDRAGNIVEASTAFTVSLGVPTMTVFPSGADAPRDAPVVVSFKDQVARSTVSIVVGGVSGSVSWKGCEAIFTPSVPLSSNTVYQATVAGVDIEGRAFSHSWSFTTEGNGQSISGVVLDSGGKAVSDAVVALSNGMRTTTDRDGSFLFADVPPGRYAISVTKDGYQVMTADVNISAAQASVPISLRMEAESGPPLAYLGIAALVSSGAIAVVFGLRRRG